MAKGLARVIAGAVTVAAAMAVMPSAGAAVSSPAAGKPSTAQRAVLARAHDQALREERAKPDVHTVTGPSTSASCPASYLCVWVNSNFGGDRGKFEDKNTNWTEFKDHECYYPAAAHDADGTWNDCASSAYDNGTSSTPYAVVWQNVNYSGDDW
jgi:hypothetical protein